MTRLPKLTQAEKQRFLDKIKQLKTGCWLWSGSRDRGGYGTVQLHRGGKAKKLKAHRVSYEIHKGNIHSGMHVLHICDVRHCVNPDHLKLGTLSDNNLDRDQKGRTYSKLSKKQMQEIILCQGKRHKEIAKKYGVTRSLVSHIKAGRRGKIGHAALVQGDRK